VEREVKSVVEAEWEVKSVEEEEEESQLGMELSQSWWSRW
jgi:hypothetical protein